jgi:hypothetical protein
MVQLLNPIRKAINILTAGKHCKQRYGEDQVSTDKGNCLS